MKLYNLVKAEARFVRWFRVYHYIYKFSRPLGLVLYNIAKMKFSVDIAPEAEIGQNFKIVHIGGIVIGGNVRIGDNVTVQSCVTLGMVGGPSRDMPTVDDNVFIGTGAKILGGVTIGEGTIVGANAVVVRDTEPNSTYAGVPAKRLR